MNDERATYGESPKRGERAIVWDSVNVCERANHDESATRLERAKFVESTISVEPPA